MRLNLNNTKRRDDNAKKSRLSTISNKKRRAKKKHLKERFETDKRISKKLLNDFDCAEFRQRLKDKIELFE